MASTEVSTPPVSNGNTITHQQQRKGLSKLIRVLLGPVVIIVFAAAAYWLAPWVIGTPLYQYRAAQYSLEVPVGYEPAISNTSAANSAITRFTKQSNAYSGIFVSVQPRPYNLLDLSDQNRTTEQIKQTAHEGLSGITQPMYNGIGEISLSSVRDNRYRVNAVITKDGQAASRADAIVLVAERFIYIVAVAAGGDPGLARQTSKILDSLTPLQ